MFLTVNGAARDDAETARQMLRPEFLMQSGIFETVRIYGGRAFRLQEHLTRFHEGAKALQLDPEVDVESLVGSELARAVGAGLANAFLRVTLVPGTLVTLIDELPPLDPGWYAKGISVKVSKVTRNEFSNESRIKTTASLASIRAFRSEAISGADDLIFLDTEGHLSEATASNVFFVSEGTAYTPPLSCGALPGITRKTILEILKRVGIPVIDNRALYLAELESASECFLTSSIREVVPVTTVNGEAVGTGKPGLITRGIINNYSKATR